MYEELVKSEARKLFRFIASKKLPSLVLNKSSTRLEQNLGGSEYITVTPTWQQDFYPISAFCSLSSILFLKYTQTENWKVDFIEVSVFTKVLTTNSSKRVFFL